MSWKAICGTWRILLLFCLVLAVMFIFQAEEAQAQRAPTNDPHFWWADAPDNLTLVPADPILGRFMVTVVNDGPGNLTMNMSWGFEGNFTLEAKGEYGFFPEGAAHLDFWLNVTEPMSESSTAWFNLTVVDWDGGIPDNRSWNHTFTISRILALLSIQYPDEIIIIDPRPAQINSADIVVGISNRGHQTATVTSSLFCRGLLTEPLGSTTSVNGKFHSTSINLVGAEQDTPAGIYICKVFVNLTAVEGQVLTDHNQRWEGSAQVEVLGYASIELESDEVLVEIGPGDSGQVKLSMTNLGNAPFHFHIQINGADSGAKPWEHMGLKVQVYPHRPAELLLEPGASIDLTINIDTSRWDTYHGRFFQEEFVLVNIEARSGDEQGSVPGALGDTKDISVTVKVRGVTAWGWLLGFLVLVLFILGGVYLKMSAIKELLEMPELGSEVPTSKTTTTGEIKSETDEVLEVEELDREEGLPREENRSESKEKEAEDSTSGQKEKAGKKEGEKKELLEGESEDDEPDNEGPDEKEPQVSITPGSG